MQRAYKIIRHLISVAMATAAFLFIALNLHAEFIITGGTVTLSDNAILSADDITLTNGSLVANATEIIVGSSWTRTGGSFSYGTSTVTFMGTGTGLTSALIGSTTFYRLRANNPGTTIRFTAGTTQYVTTRLTLEDVTLRSTSNNATWYLVLSGSNQNVNGVNVKDSNASGGNTITATNGFNAGNNTNWSFAVTDTGDRYWVASTAGGWTNSANWSLASGGSGGAQVPLSTHTVIFNANGTGDLNLNTIVDVSTLNIAGYTGIWNTQGYAVTVTKRFEHTSGTVNLGASTITIQGNFDRSGGNFSAGTSTITFSGGNDQTLISGSTGFHHIVIDKSAGTLTLSDALDVNGDITITAGTLDSNNQSVNIAGHWTRTSGVFTPGTSLVIFDGTSTSRLTGSTTFYGLESTTPSKTLEFAAGTTFYVTDTLNCQDINLKSSVDDFQWHLKMSGANQTILNVNVRDSQAGSGQTIRADSASVNSGNNQNWAFGDAYRYWIATTASNWNSSANWSLAGGGSGGASVPTSTHTVIFDGSNGANGTALVNTTLNISTIIISGYTGNINSQGFAITVSSAFVQETGTVSIGTSVVTIQGDLLRTGGSFSTGISTIQFTGDKNQTLTPGATAFHHVVVNKTGGSVTLGGDLNLIGQMTITAGTFDTSSTGHYVSSSTLLNIQASGIYNANNSTITLTGTAGTLFTRAGTFNQGNSKVVMTPNSASTLTSNHPITFHNLELSPTITVARTYTLGTNALTINGDFNINPTAATQLGLTVNLGSTTVVVGTTTVQGTTLGRANLSTVASWPLTTGNLNIVANSTVTANAATITLNGTGGPLLTRSGAFTQGTSTVDIESDADVIITNDAVTFNNLTMTSTITTNRTYTFGSGGVTVSGNWTINPVKSDAGNAILEIDLGAGTTVAAAGTLTVNGTTNASSVFDTTVSNYALSAGKINIGSLGSLRGNGSNITLTGTTSTLFTNTGNFVPGTSNVIINPDAAVTLTSGFITFGNLTLSPTISVARAYTFGGSSLTISGDFNINPNAGSALALTVNLGSTTVVIGTTTVRRTGSATANLTTTGSNHPLTSGEIDLQTGGTLTGNASTIALNGPNGPLLAMNGGTYTVGTSTLDIESDADVTITSGTVTLNNLTMTSTITANRLYTFGSTAIQINGSWTINPVKSDAGDAILEVDLRAGTTVAAAGTLTINGTNNASSILDTTSSNHALSAGKINIGANGTLRGNGSNITLTGTTATLFTNTGSFVPSTSTVIMTPDATISPLTSGFITFNNLTLSPTITAGRAYTFGTSSLTINGMFNINPTAGTAQALAVNLASTTVVGATTTITRTTSATSSLTTTGSNFPFTTANLNVATGGTFTANASSITLTGTTSPLITRTGTFTQGTSTVTVTSAANVILNSGTITFNHLYIDAPLETISMGAATTVSGVLTINQGTLADAGFQITGNASNRFVMASDTEFKIGSAATGTTFPTNFTTANISFALGSTVTYNAGVVQAISGTPSYANLNLVAPSGTPTKTPGAAVSVRGDMTIGASNTYSNGALSLTIGGNYTNNGTFTASTGSTTFNSTTSGNTLAGNLTGSSQFNNLAFNGVGGEWTPTSTLTVASTLTVTAGTLLGTNDITVNGGVLGNGTNGIINLSGGTFTQRVAANQYFGSNAAGANDWTFNNLTFSNSSAANRTITTSGAGTGGIVVNGTLTIGQGADTNSTTLANSTSTGNRFFDANSDLNITTRGVWQASSMTVLNVGGNWTNSGTFTILRSTVIFDGAGIQTLTGATTFYGLRATTSGGTLRFTAGTTQYISNMVEFQNVTLESTSNGATWYFRYSGSSQTLSNLDVRDSNASSGSLMQAFDSTDNGNNTNWDFGSPAAITNLSALVSTVGRTIDLTWTAPGDDGSIGTLVSSTYTIQYTTDTTFGQSSSWDPTAGGMPSYVYRVHIATNNVNPGTDQHYRITGLTDGSTYFFRIWTKDHLGNYSEISNGATNFALTQILSVSLSWNSLTIPGAIDLNTTLVISTSVVVTNDGNVPETFEFRATTATIGSPWTIQPTQSTDQFVLWAISNPTEPTTGNFGNEDRLGETNLRCTSTALSNGSTTCVSVPPGESRIIWFKLGMPTLTTTGMSQDIRITGTATVPD